MWNKIEDCSNLDVSLVALKAKYKKGQIIPTIKREKIQIDKGIVDKMLLQFTNIKVAPIPNQAMMVQRMNWRLIQYIIIVILDGGKKGLKIGVN